MHIGGKGKRLLKCCKMYMRAGSCYSSTDNLCPNTVILCTQLTIPHLKEVIVIVWRGEALSWRSTKHNNYECTVSPRQLTVQESSWTSSSAAFTTWFSCCLPPARKPHITAAPTTNKSTALQSLHPAAVTTLAWLWTVVCSAPVRM